MKIKYDILDYNMPSPEEVLKYIDKWNGLPDYSSQERALNKLFLDLCKDNLSIENILIKCSALNDFYSTNIFKIYSVAKHILDLNIDERLAKGNLSLVDDIARVTIDGKTFNFYSFASKYCSHHRPDIYPIYDFYVDWLLCYFNKRDCFSSFKADDLKDYLTFVKVIEAFRSHYGLVDFSIKQIDQYLWLLGKECIDRYEKKTKK